MTRARGFSRIVALACVVAAAATVDEVAAVQDARTFVQVGSLEVAPEDIETALAQVKIVRDAAVEVGLDAAFRWDAYMWDNTLHFVSWHTTLADLDDPNAMAAAFAGTSAADRVTAAFQAFGQLDVVSSTSQVSVSRPDLSYIPANPAMAQGGQGGAYLIQQWPKGDQAEAFEESVKDLVGMLREMDGPYPVFISQNVIGDGGATFAVMFDNLSNFYGANSLEAGLADSGMGPAWQEWASAHQRLVSRSQSRHVNYLPEHSYRPDLADGM